MRARAIAVTAALAASLGAIGGACGISTQVEDIFGGPAGDGGAGGTGVTSGGGGQGGDPAGSSSSAQASGSSSQASSVSSSSSAEASSSSSGGDPQVELSCGGAPCAAGQICCFYPGSDQSHCGAPGSCEDAAVVLACNDVADCPGGVCCGDWDYAQGMYTGVSCQATCEGTGHILQCEGTPDICPFGQDCHPSGILGPGYSFCQ